MVDVNFYKDLQGDAHIILDHGFVALVDAGYGGLIGDSLVNHLNELGISKIHKFIISHPHRDHYEGIKRVLNSGIKVDEVYYNFNTSMNDCCFVEDHFLNTISALEKQGASINDVSEGQKISIGQTAFDIVFAAKSQSLDGRKIDMNDASIVMKWSAFDHSVLFSGDLNSTSGEYLVNHRSTDIRADILKVPHHGAAGIAPTEFFQAVSPKLLMFPDPRWVRGSKRGETAFGYFSSSGVKGCSNSQNGTVKLVFNSESVIALPDKASASCGSGIILSS